MKMIESGMPFCWQCYQRYDHEDIPHDWDDMQILQDENAENPAYEVQEFEMFDTDDDAKSSGTSASWNLAEFVGDLQTFQIGDTDDEAGSTTSLCRSWSIVGPRTEDHDDGASQCSWVLEDDVALLRRPEERELLEEEAALRVALRVGARAEVEARVAPAVDHLGREIAEERHVAGEEMDRRVVGEEDAPT